MKLSIFFAAFAYAQEEVNDDVCFRDGQEVECVPAESGLSIARSRTDKSLATGSGDRRYNDLKEMAIKHWSKNGFRGKNNGFDERKYWAYGCHCFLLGDRPMSEMGKGKPVDALDNKCKAYKDCQKCVRATHGEDCIGENRKYTWGWVSKKDKLVSPDTAGSCERELFECDLKLVHDMFSQKEVFNNIYHAFWSEEGFDNRDSANCPKKSGTPVEHECCGGHNSPYYWIGLNQNQCCATQSGQGGTVAAAGTTCEY